MLSRVRQWSTGLALSALTSATVYAGQWPDRPITLIVPFAAGGATDIVARVVSDSLSRELKQSVVVENRAGAAGVVGMSELARSKPDGYSFALVTDSIPIQPLLVKSLPWTMDSFEPIAKIATSPEVLVVYEPLAAQTVQELVDMAKQRPGELTFAASSTGSVHHLAGEMFKQQTDVDMVHIPYKGGGQSIVDMIAGRIDLGFIGLAPVLPYLKTGQLRALAQTGVERNSHAPTVPTFIEAGFAEFDVELWVGLLGLKGMPEDAQQGMRQALDKVMQSPQLQHSLREIGFEPVTGEQDDFPAWMMEQQAAWQKVVEQLDM